MNELIKALQSRIADLEQDIARYENARIMGAYHLDYWRSKALGSEGNMHPAAVENRAAAKAIMAKLEVLCPIHLVLTRSHERHD